MFRVFFLYFILLLIWYFLFSTFYYALSRRSKEIENPEKNINNSNNNMTIEADIEEKETNEDKLVKQLRIKEIVPIGNTMTDCAIDAKFCHVDTDCEYLCKRYKRIKFACDFNHTCAPRQIDGGNGGGGDDDDIPLVKCDTKLGEYAMLVGYTTIGTAIWQCI